MDFALKDDELVLQSDEQNTKSLILNVLSHLIFYFKRRGIEQINKQLTSDIIEGLDISLEEHIRERFYVYTPVELFTRRFITLVKSFNAYDNLMKKIKQLNATVDNLLSLTKMKDQTVYLYNIQRTNLYPNG